MVEVQYLGQLGNRLFQYCFGRILAENLNFELKADPIPHFPNTKSKISAHNYSEYPTQLIKSQKVNLDSILKDKTKRKIVLNEFFQRYEYYKPYKDVIRNNWLVTDMQPKDKIGEGDIVVCVRRSDYITEGHALPFSYFEEALSMTGYDRLFICTDVPRDPFVMKFKRKYNAIIRIADKFDDFEFIKSANKIIISNSSFHWWAAFLSNAKKIYAPIPLEGHWSYDASQKTGADLTIDDEPRYVYIKCREVYKKTLTETLAEKRKKIKGWIGVKMPWVVKLRKSLP